MAIRVAEEATDLPSKSTGGVRNARPGRQHLVGESAVGHPNRQCRLTCPMSAGGRNVTSGRSRGRTSTGRQKQHVMPWSARTHGAPARGPGLRGAEHVPVVVPRPLKIAHHEPEGHLDPLGGEAASLRPVRAVIGHIMPGMTPRLLGRGGAGVPRWDQRAGPGPRRRRTRHPIAPGWQDGTWMTKATSSPWTPPRTGRRSSPRSLATRRCRTRRRGHRRGSTPDGSWTWGWGRGRPP